MPRGPKGERRTRDVIGNAVHVMRIATGQIEDKITDDGKNAAAVALGRMGGKARAAVCRPRSERQLPKRPQPLGGSPAGVRPFDDGRSILGEPASEPRRSAVQSASSLAT